MTKKTKNKSNINETSKILLIIGGSILALFLIIMFTIPFSYTATKSYTEQIPYTDKECESKDLSHNIDWGTAFGECDQYKCTEYESVCVEQEWDWMNFKYVCVDYEDECIYEECSLYTDKCAVIVKNLDSESGFFSLRGLYQTKYGGTKEITTVSHRLQAQEEKVFTWQYTLNYDNKGKCSYNQFKVPTKQICETITKYRDERKTTKVTLSATLIQQWTGIAPSYIHE